MQVRHSDAKLDRLEIDPSYDAGFGRPLVRGFRKVMAWIREADDERDLYSLKSLHFEKLKGARDHQRSVRLNDQFRLILELEQAEQGKTIVVISIEDYH
jgi:proteic killer suppression protein